MTEVYAAPDAASTEKTTPNYSLLYAPRRTAGPLAQRFAGPLGSLIRVARIAGVGHLILRRSRRWDELEGMRADVDVGKLDGDLRHVAVYALVARAAGFVLGVRLDTCAARPVG